MRVSGLHLYPVKSLGGVDVAEAVVEPWGLAGDRRWLVLRPDGDYLTARDEHRMLGLTATPLPGDRLRLRGLDGSVVEVDPPVDGPLAPTSISRLESVRLPGPEVGRWLSEQLGRPLRLGWLDDPRRRSIAFDRGGRPGDPLSLADAAPLLVATTASMNRLNDWIAEVSIERGEGLPDPLPISRFRPNVVVDGVAEPFAEDHWETVTIGEVRFRFAEVCDRCVLTTIDAKTFESGREPIRTLARFRQWDHRTFFGVRVVPFTSGLIRLNDRVAVA